MINFPFPFTGDQLPVGRFDFTDEFCFAYMGREAFFDLWGTVTKLKVRQSYSRLYIQGTIGYGKSHILAVLVGFLSRKGKRVVYLPDCRELLARTMRYMQTALLCAFADPASSGVRDEIRALKSSEEVVAFCEQHRSTYFIIDQINALDFEDANRDRVGNDRKKTAEKFLDELTYGQYRITSASANYKMAVHMGDKEISEKRLALMGGMSEVRTRHSFLVSFPFFARYRMS